jgi:hypothetical protein
VNLVDLSNPAAVHSIMALDGEFDAAQLSWLDQRKIALAAYTAGSGAEPSTAEVPEGGLYLITFGAGNSTRHLNEIHCPLSPLAFSPNGHLAIAQGGGGAAPAVIDVSDQTCKALDLSRPIQVLGWAPDSTAFLYTAAGQSGVFGLDLTSGRSSTIAVSSAAAAYAADGTIAALGSQGLSWKRAAGPSNARVKVQIALFDKAHSQITINSLGFATEPALLAQSTMVFSQVSNDGLIDTAMPTDAAPMRAIIEYSYPARAAFVIARGPVRGPIAMSWSPEGKRAAIVDGDGTRSTLAVIGLPK